MVNVYAGELYRVASKSLRVAARFIVKVLTAGLIVILTEPNPTRPPAQDPRDNDQDTDDEFWR